MGITAKKANILKTLDLIKDTRKQGVVDGAIWKTTDRYEDWKAYHTTKYVTPEHVLAYINGNDIIDPAMPASNFLVDAYDQVIGMPEFWRVATPPGGA